MAVTVSVSGTSVTFCNGYGYTVDINVTYTGNSTTYKLISLNRGQCSTQIFPIGNFSYGVYEDFYGGSTRLERGDFVVSSSSGGDSGDEEEEFIDPYITSFGADTGTYNSSTGILSFNMAVRVMNENSYSTTGTIQIIIDGEVFQWSGTIPSGSNRVTSSLAVEVNIGKLSAGTYTDYQVDFSYNFYWKNQDTGYTDGYNDTDYIYVDFTVSNTYEDFYWADGTTTISKGDIFTKKIDASTWLDLISKVNKVTGSSVSTGGSLLVKNLPRPIITMWLVHQALQPCHRGLIQRLLILMICVRPIGKKQDYSNKNLISLFLLNNKGGGI